MTDGRQTVNSNTQRLARNRFSPSLAQIVFVSVTALAIGLGIVLCIFYWSAQNALLESSNQFRGRLRQDFNRRADEFFGRAERPLSELAELIKQGLLSVDDVEALEREIFYRVSGEAELTEVAVTFSGTTRRGEISVWREKPGNETAGVNSRISQSSGNDFVAKNRQWRAALGDPKSISWGQESKIEDPTQSPEYLKALQLADQSGFVWSDLTYFRTDGLLPAEQRRIVFWVQHPIKDSKGQVIGLLRAALRADRVNEIVQLDLAEGGKPDPHLIFISDLSGRMISRATPQTPLLETEGAIRARNDYPPHVGEILKLIAAGNLPKGQSLSRRLNGEQYILGYRPISRINAWVACIVVLEESSYGGMVTLLKSALGGTIIIFIGIFILSVLMLRLIRSNLKQLTAQSINMREFDFTRSNERPLIRDVKEVMDSMEQAKTSMRSMSKYVPITLVKQLYQMHAEPTLGSELTDASILFTDIKNFTTMAERLSPNDLAIVLGRYLETMSNEIQSHQGTIDKFIGDAVMALWNAPLPVQNHSLQACRAAWGCTQALQKLFSSKDWGDYPRLETGFGIHRNEVMIGHFGAPSRFSYTAIGDAVNFASRLEGLNRLFGTTILVSETVYKEAKEEFLFRLVEIVAVKGKNNGMHIYELIGPLKEVQSRVEGAQAYETAFALYLQREFEKAAALFEKMPGDIPAQLLAERCREMIRNPPPANWDGVHVVKTK